MDLSAIKLVLLPGMYGTGVLFADFVEALPSDLAAQVIGYPNDEFLSYSQLVDLIGSMVPAGPYAIVAESYSTTVAIQFAATHPVDLKGLVLSAGFATSPVRGWSRRVCRALIPVMPWLPVPEIAAGLVFRPSAARPLQFQVRDAMASAAPKVLKERARAALGCNVLEELRQIEVPLLYLQARHDRIVNPDCLDEIRRAKPEIEVVILDSSHMVLQEMPRETAQLVVDFVRRL